MNIRTCNMIGIVIKEFEPSDFFNFMHIILIPRAAIESDPIQIFSCF